MNKKEAIQIIQNALTGYVEDSAGANSEEAKEIQKAFDVVKEKPKLSIRVHFSDEDLEELQRGRTFEWSFPTEEDPSQSIDIELFKGDEED